MLPAVSGIYTNNITSPSYLPAMSSQHTSPETEEEMEDEFDNIIKTVTSLQKDIEEIVEEYKLLLHPVQSQTWTSKHAYDSTRVVDVVIENQENIELARPYAIGSDSSSKTENGEQKNQHFAGKSKKGNGQVDSTKALTATMALNFKKTIETVMEQKENITDESSTLNSSGDVTGETTEKEVPCDECTSATNKKGDVTDGKSDSWTIGDLFKTRILRMMWPPSWFLSNKEDGGIKSRENHCHHESSHFDNSHQNQHFAGKSKKGNGQVDSTKALTATMALNLETTIETVMEQKENITDESSTLNGIELSKRNLSEKLEKFETSFEQCLNHLQSHKTHFVEKFKALKNENKDMKEKIMNINRNDHPDVREPSGNNESRSSCPEASRLSGKTIKVVSQMYCPKPSDMATSVTKELSVMLTKHMKTHGIKLKMQIYRKVQDLQKDVPLILICLQSSRLGTDVKNATKAIQTGPNVAVLIFHHADIHALPIQRSRKVLTAPEYKEVGTIIDMGFLSEKGIYDCEMNKEALKDLTSFLKQ